MGKLPLNRTVDGVIAREPREVLRSHGFRRKGRNFHRNRNELVNSAWFQTMRGMPFAFCVNLTLIQAEHHRVWSGRPLPASPSADNSVFLANVRVAFETPEGDQNHWWIVRSETDTPSIARHVAERLESSLAFFDEWRSLAELTRAAERGEDDRLSVRSLDLPILLLAQNDARRAAAALQSLPPSESVFSDVVERLTQGIENAR